jgi:hypothetical protein
MLVEPARTSMSEYVLMELVNDIVHYYDFIGYITNFLCVQALPSSYLSCFTEIRPPLTVPPLVVLLPLLLGRRMASQ